MRRGVVFRGGVPFIEESDLPPPSAAVPDFDGGVRQTVPSLVTADQQLATFLIHGDRDARHEGLWQEIDIE